MSVIMDAIHQQQALRFHVKTERVAMGILRGKRPRWYRGRKRSDDVIKALVSVLLILAIVIVSLLIARCPIEQTVIRPT
ncbi:MAG: hypothetical protein VST67_13390 [Nitrospirota bacterium]|nr:hypothetical protein [Nitrospirota bacterium]